MSESVKGKHTPCDHKCHRGARLNPWVEFCPICGCVNENYDANAELPAWGSWNGGGEL